MRKGPLVRAVLSGVIGLAASLTSLAEQRDQGSYWTDSSGAVWRTGFGACWGTSWTSQNYRADCTQPAKAQAHQGTEVAAMEASESTTEMAAMETPKAVAPTVAPTKVNLDTVTLFDFDSAKLRPAGADAIDDLAAKAKGTSQIVSVQVAGYTDSTGPAQYNLKLSERRAEAVKNQLVLAGVDASTIETQSYGEADPIASNATRTGRQQNRRVVVQIVAEQSQ
jgi:OOP family OmpA-OmpF porin